MILVFDEDLSSDTSAQKRPRIFRRWGHSGAYNRQGRFHISECEHCCYPARALGFAIETPPTATCAMTAFGTSTPAATRSNYTGRYRARKGRVMS